MWAHLIIFPSPLTYQYLCFIKSCKDFPIKQLIPHLPVKGFDVTILPWATRLNKEHLYSQPIQPFPHCPGGELGTVVRADMLRNTTQNEQCKKLIYHILRPDPAINLRAQILPGEFIDDIQYFKGPAIGRAVYHEVIAPDMVLMLWPQPDTGAVIKP
jgi:hypothetical protein